MPNNKNIRKKVLYLVPNEDAYVLKRVRMLQRCGAVPIIAGFRRKGDFYPKQEFEYMEIGEIEHGEYISRIPKIISGVVKIKNILTDVEVIYAFQLDQLLIAWFASIWKKTKVFIVYDVSDIRSILVSKSILGMLARAFERIACKQISLLVCSSQHYVNDYFKNVNPIKNTPVIIVENKIDELATGERLDRVEKHAEPYVIGYIGVIRCQKSWQLINELALKSETKYKIKVHGFFRNIKDAQNYHTNIQYCGPFKSPEQLNSIYKSIDIGYIAHAHGETNTKWARSTRFYQCCYYRKPMIAQKGTIDGEIVEKYNVGIVVDIGDIKNTVNSILKWSYNDILECALNINKIPKNEYMHTNEHQQIYEMISK